MNQRFKHITWLLLACFILSINSNAQDDSTQPVKSINIRYFSVNNKLNRLVVDAKIKTEKWVPLKNEIIELYLDSTDAKYLVAKMQTAEDGTAGTFVPPQLRDQWNSNSVHRFIATNEMKEVLAELELTKARIMIDTSNDDGTRSLNIKVEKLVHASWQPAGNVEVKIGVRRLGGFLPVGEEETYTTDSTGLVNAEFLLDSLPGDEKGNIIVAARTEDNELFGNLSIEQTVPWGIHFDNGNSFGKRSLWANKNNAPIWLMSMAYFIIVSVWLVIFYLCYLFFKVKRAGREQLQKSPNLLISEY